jgi:hypothetical protein
VARWGTVLFGCVAKNDSDPLARDLRRNRHNNTNLERFKSLWAETIRRDFVDHDAQLAASSYLRGALTQPMRANASKIIRSVIILTGLYRLTK